MQDVVFGDTDFGGTDFGESGGSLDPLASTPPPLTASLDALVAAPASTASLDALVAAPAPPAPPAPPVGLSDDPTEDLLDPLAVAAPSPAAVVAAPSQAAVVAAPSQAAYVDLDEDLLDSFAAVRVADEVNRFSILPKSLITKILSLFLSLSLSFSLFLSLSFSLFHSLARAHKHSCTHTRTRISISRGDAWTRRR